MTTILINEIRISYSQVWAKINGIDQCFEPFDLSQILKHIDEKTITVLSAEYHKHNDIVAFRNNYMITLSRILHNANYNQLPNNKNQFDDPYWVIADQHWTKENRFIITTLMNLKGEKLRDD